MNITNKELKTLINLMEHEVKNSTTHIELNNPVMPESLLAYHKHKIATYENFINKAKVDLNTTHTIIVE